MDEVFFNAVVVNLTEPGGAVRVGFHTGGGDFTFPVQHSYWTDGAVGHLHIAPELCGGRGFSFIPYPDQRLRRAPEDDLLDNPFARLWGWTIGETADTQRRFRVKAGIIPGQDGRVIEDETQPVEIEVPPEFYELCEEYGVTVDLVLRGFIADVCSLSNSTALPREDSYSSNGSDERDMAADYFNRAYFRGDKAREPL